MEVGSLGFIDAKSGRLKSKDELESLDKPKNESSQSSESSNDSNDTSASNALSFAKKRTAQQVNGFVGVLNRDRENLRAAKENVQNLRSTAKELKQAIKSGDDGRADELREQFRSQLEERNALADRIERDNREEAPNRRQGIRVGNETRGTFEAREVEFRRAPEVDVNTKEGVDAFLEGSKQELEGINNQIERVKTTRSEVREVNRGARNELNALAKAKDTEKEEALTSFDEAQKAANDVAALIGSQASLESSLVSNIDASVARTLLE